MKISSLPWGVLSHRKYSLDAHREWFQLVAADPNIDGVDLVDGKGSLCGEPAKKKKCRSLKPVLDDLALPVMMFVSHGNFLVSPISTEEQNRFNYLIDQAQFFEAAVFRTTTGLTEPGELFRPGIMENVLSGLRWLAERVRKAGFPPLIVENNKETTDELILICERLSDLGVKLNCEIKPAFRYHMDPYVYVQRLVSYSTWYHLDNFKYTLETTWEDQDRAGRKLKRSIPLDQGEIDIRRILSIIKASGFDGWLSIEYGGNVASFDDLLRSAKFVRTVWDGLR